MCRTVHNFVGAIVIAALAVVGAVATPWLYGEALPNYPLRHWTQSAVLATVTGASVGALFALCLGARLSGHFAILFGITLGYLLPELADRGSARFLPWQDYLAIRTWLGYFRITGPFLGVLVGTSVSVRCKGFSQSAAMTSIASGAIAMIPAVLALGYAPIDAEFTQEGARSLAIIVTVTSILSAMLVGTWIGRDQDGGRGFELTTVPQATRTRGR